MRITTDAILIEADGSLTPVPLLLNRPGRLVLDFPGLVSIQEKVPVPAANRFGIVRCRQGEDNNRLRLVFEVGADVFPEYRLTAAGNRVEITPAPSGRQLMRPD
jgi:hypothetical protein